MTGFVLEGSDCRVLLSHAALAGLGAILEEAGVNPRVGWTMGMAPRPVVYGCPPEQVAALVRAHAARHAESESWVSQTFSDNKGKSRGLMSPRLTTLTISEGWCELERRRNEIIDALTGRRTELDLRLLGALGRPAYWRMYQRQRRQDDGASRWEMQPRNQGSEFVRNRLSPLARAVAARSDTQVLDGLIGVARTDEAGHGKADSRTATGLAAPGPTDNALAWCALWGISQYPLALRVRQRAVTSGHIEQPEGAWFYTPVWHGAWRMARLRTMLAGLQIREVALKHIENRGYAGDFEDVTAPSWLVARGVTAVLCFPVSKHGSDNAPERRAGLARVYRLGTP